MSIMLIGGHDRMHRQYIDISKQHGHKLKVYTQMPAKFEKCFGNPDAIFVFTNTVSHKMLITAQKQAKKKGIPIYKSHSSSGSSLKELVMKASEQYA